MRPSAPIARQALTGVLAIATAAGYLLVSGTLDPVLRDVVVLAIGRQAGTAVDGGPKVARVADWQYFDDRPEWSPQRLVATGPTAPEPPNAPRRPQVAPPENPHHWQFSGPAPMPHYTLRARSSCFQPRGPGATVPSLTATPGKGSATVSWWDLGDPDTRSYQIDAVPVGQVGAVIRTTVAAPNACKSVSVPVRGLKTGVVYQFTLLATNQSQVQTARTYQISRGQTQAVVIG
jgi:hypothetical protein